MTRDEWMDELASDPARGGSVTPKGIAEREAGIGLQERGEIPGPIRRDPTGASEFIDSTGQSWDVKGYHSDFPNGFNPAKIEADMRIDVQLGEHHIIDTRNMSADDVRTLEDIVTRNGWSDSVRWYP